MLGKKEEGQTLASISQGSFIKYLLKLISKDPDGDARNIKIDIALVNDIAVPLRKYFIEEKDSVIHKIILNYLLAVKSVFEDEWTQPERYILYKSIGFGALVKAFPTIYAAGVADGDLSESHFLPYFRELSAVFWKEKL